MASSGIGPYGPTEKKVKTFPEPGAAGALPRAHAVVYLAHRSFFVPLEEGKTAVFGRSDEATVQIETPTVSRLHFALQWAEGKLTISDQGSTNGTFIDGERLVDKAVLTGGEEIVAGDALVVVGLTSPLPAARRVAPAQAFSDRLSQQMVNASRSGRPLALVRAHFAGGEAAAAHGLATLLAALPGQPTACSVGPSDFKILVDQGAEAVGGICERLTGEQGCGASTLTYGLALFPRDGSDLRAIEERAEATLATGASAPPAPAPSGDGPVAVDPATLRVFAIVDRVAALDGTVLLVGETGVGKEVVAQEIHRRSGRAGGPFVPVNCGAIPSTLFARELFGHEKGAFTGARERSAGVFEAASGGTLFLDEVGEIPLADQAHLLRAIEQREVTRLGGTKAVPVDIRIVAATNRDLDDLVRQGTFRQDLLYRLDVLSILVPALRDRTKDIAPLATRFFADAVERCRRPGLTIDDDALGALERYGWPGNVRELRNVVERIVLLADGSAVTAGDVLGVLYPQELAEVDFVSGASLQTLVEEVEREAILRALDSCGGNQTLAAERLGISRRTLIYRMQRYGFPGRGRGAR